MKRTNIYCITTPEEVERLFKLAEVNGLTKEPLTGKNDTVLLMNDGVVLSRSEIYASYLEEMNYTKVTPQYMEAVITSVPVYLPMEDWDKFLEQIHFTNPDATRIANAIQSQLKQ